MTDDETPPRVPAPWIYAVLLVLAATTAACTVSLQSAGEPKAPAPARTAVPPATAKSKRVRHPASPSPSPTASPSPIPRLAHLDVPTDVADTGGAPVAAAPADVAAAAPPPAPASTTTTTTAAAAVAPVEPAPAVTPGTSGIAILERRGDFLVTASRLNGQPFGDLFLDTGAGATFIDQRLADDRQLPEIITASTEGARAAREASIREVSGLTIGDVTLATERAFVVDLHDADSVVGSPLAGVIGLSALGAAPFTLDFTTGTLTIHTDASFDPPTSVPADALRMDQGLPFVEATLADGTSVWLLLDTGSAPAITVWRGFAKQHPGMIRTVAAAPTTPPNPDAPLASPTPEPPRGSELRAFHIFGDKFDRIPVLVQDPPARPWQRARVVGRVGMALLRDLRITIHPATERIWVERLRPPNGP